MAEIENIIPTSERTELVPLSEVDKNVLQNINRQEKEERISTDTGLATEMENLMSTEGGLDRATSVVEQGQSYPLTMVDYSGQLKEELGQVETDTTNYSGTLSPIPVSGAAQGGNGFFGAIKNAAKPVGDLKSAIMDDLPEDLYTTVEGSGEPIFNGLQFSKTVKATETEGYKDQGVYTLPTSLIPPELSEDVDLYSGTIFFLFVVDPAPSKTT